MGIVAILEVVYVRSYGTVKIGSFGSTTLGEREEEEADDEDREEGVRDDGLVPPGFLLPMLLSELPSPSRSFSHFPTEDGSVDKKSPRTCESRCPI